MHMHKRWELVSCSQSIIGWTWLTGIGCETWIIGHAIGTWYSYLNAASYTVQLFEHSLVYGAAVWTQFGIQYSYLNVVWPYFSHQDSILSRFCIICAVYNCVTKSSNKEPCSINQNVTGSTNYIDSWFLWVSAWLNNDTNQSSRIFDDRPISNGHTTFIAEVDTQKSGPDPPKYGKKWGPI